MPGVKKRRKTKTKREFIQRLVTQTWKNCNWNCTQVIKSHEEVKREIKIIIEWKFFYQLLVYNKTSTGVIFSLGTFFSQWHVSSKWKGSFDMLYVVANKQSITCYSHCSSFLFTVCLLYCSCFTRVYCEKWWKWKQQRVPKPMVLQNWSLNKVCTF